MRFETSTRFLLSNFEDTWEHLALERLSVGIDDERGSKWQWERFSEF